LNLGLTLAGQPLYRLSHSASPLSPSLDEALVHKLYLLSNKSSFVPGEVGVHLSTPVLPPVTQSFLSSRCQNGVNLKKNSVTLTKYEPGNKGLLILELVGALKSDLAPLRQIPEVGAEPCR
jgi:hypothetical protein